MLSGLVFQTGASAFLTNILGSALNAIGVKSALAETMSSTNYRVQTDILSQGGGGSSSTNFDADDTIGDLATGEDLNSTNYRACAGYECFDGQPYITFSVRAGLTEGTATAGTPVELGTIDTTTVKTSDGTTINSIFIDIDSNAPGGNVVTVRSENNGLQHSSGSPTIAAADTIITAGTSAFGICVFSTTEDGFSPTALMAVPPYDGTCDKTTGHEVGGPTNTTTDILSSSGPVSNGQAEILVKAAVSGTQTSGDYEETLTFVATGTY